MAMQQPQTVEPKYKSVARLLPVELYVAVDVVDAAGNQDNLLIFRAKGTKQFFKLLPGNAEKQMKPLAGWLVKELEKMADPVTESSDSVPPDMGSPVPFGGL